MKLTEQKNNVLQEGRGGCLDAFVTFLTAGHFGLMTQIISNQKFIRILTPTKIRRVMVRTPKVELPIVEQ